MSKVQVSFAAQKSKLKLNTTAKLRDYLIGKKVVILTGGYSGHNYGGDGDSFVIEPTAIVSSSGNGSLNRAKPGGNTIYFTEFAVVQEETIEDIKKIIKNLKQDKKDIDVEIASYESKIEFMQVNSLEKYDEDEFKVFSTLKTLEDSSTSTMDKAKAIAKLIKG